MKKATSSMIIAKKLKLKHDAEMKREVKSDTSTGTAATTDADTDTKKDK